jgi:hypothetical protein
VKERFQFDGALREMFHEGSRTLIRLARGVEVRGFLSGDFPKVQHRHADLVIDLADDSILHIEFQSRNVARMVKRMAMYHLLLDERYGRRLRHLVLYVGQAPLNMNRCADTGPLKFECEMMDIREIAIDELLASDRPADLVLAVLARGSEERLPEIVGRIARLPAEQRGRAAAQLAVLCGLRALSGRLELETEHMSVIISIKDNVILQKIQRDGEIAALQRVVRKVVRNRFGSVPRWASERVKNASVPELEAWTVSAVSAKSIEDLFNRN